jgi:hypothetical protein
MKKIIDPSGLVGEELNAVCFVMDYVEFHFNGPVLRAFGPVTVRTRLGEAMFPGSTASDPLRELIGGIVQEVDVEDDDRILVSFTDGEELRISLSKKDRSGPEAAHFLPGPNTPIQIW